MFTKEWMYEDSVYCETVMETIQADPTERLEIVERWLNVLYKETEGPWRHEAWAHAETALCVTKDLKNRVVEPWDKKTFLKELD